MRVAVGGATPAASASSPTASSGAARSGSSRWYWARDMPASPANTCARARRRRVVRNSDSQAALKRACVSTVTATAAQSSEATFSELTTAGLRRHNLVQAELLDGLLAHLVLL